MSDIETHRTTELTINGGLFGLRKRVISAPEITDYVGDGQLNGDPRSSLWNRWAARYHTLLNLSITRGLWDGFTTVVLGEIPDRDRGIDCLDAGCGTGFVIEELARNLPNSRISGADLSVPFLIRAQERIGTKLQEAVGRVSLYRANLTESYPWEDESFDLVTMNFVFQYFSFKEQQHIVSESARVLREGGKLVISTFSEGTEFKDVVMPIFLPEIRQHGVKALMTLTNIPITKRFDHLRKQGMMNNPSISDLERMHEQAGFSDFRVARTMVHPVRKDWDYGVYTVATK